MDPITLILTALATGAAASVKDTTNTAVKDAYNALKSLVQNKFEGRKKAIDALVDYEDDPDTYEKPLKKALTEMHLDEEKKIIETAQKLMAQVNPQQAAMGKYNVQITGNIEGFAQGDYQTVSMHFGHSPSEK